MNEKKGQLLSALIGLARASENNEYKLTEDTDRIVIDSLVTLAEEDINTHVLEYLLLNIKKEKKRLVPDCFNCSSPCGRTKDYDLSLMEKDSEIIRNLKTELISSLIQIAKNSSGRKSTSYLYKGLYYMGLTDVTKGFLTYFIDEVKAIIALSSQS